MKKLDEPSTQPDGTHSVIFEGTALCIKGAQTYPAVSAFLPMAILLATRTGGGDIHVAGKLSETQLARINCEFAPFVADFFDGTECRVFAETRDLTPIAKARSGLMFSAGVDSFYTLKKLLGMNITPDIFVNIDAGAHADNDRTWRRRLENIGSVASALSIPVETVETNFHRAYLETHIKCHTIRNIAAAVALQNVSTIYYSSAYKLTNFDYAKAKAHSIAYIDPVILRSFLPSGLEAVYVGWEGDRIDKTRAICDLTLAFDHLDVCVNQTYQAERRDQQPLNCGRCNKCLRTQLELEICDALDQFYKVFDLPGWGLHRTEAIAALAKSKDPIDRNAVKHLLPKQTRVAKSVPKMTWGNVRKIGRIFQPKKHIRRSTNPAV
jgi:hypothetical protein